MAKDRSLAVAYWPLPALRVDPLSPRVHPEGQIEDLVRSIEAYGWTNPLLVADDGLVIAGEARLRAAAARGDETVPVIVLPDLTTSEVKAYRIADNKIAEQGGWNKDLLGQVIAELQAAQVDLGLTFIPDTEIAALLEDEGAGILGDLPDLAEDRDPFQKMTFTLHDVQAAIVRRALDLARRAAGVDDTLNQNRNGNALAMVCQQYLSGHGER